MDHHLVLIVEDDADLSIVLAAYFEAAGYAVHLVHGFSAAVAAVRAAAPDVVITDFRLDGLQSGRDLARWVKTEVHGLPVIGFTGTAGPGEIDDQALFVEVLTKGDPAQLVEAVNQALAHNTERS